jgi:hypothetical protein
MAAKRRRRPARPVSGPLGIICGGGAIPRAFAERMREQGREFVLFPIRGFAEPWVERFPHRWFYLGALGKLFRLLREANCREVVMTGSLVRPRIRDTARLDWLTLRMIPRFIRLYRGGDDRLLSGVVAVFAERGVRVRGMQELAPELLMPAGKIGRRAPTAAQQGDIKFGLSLIRALGPFDVGQAVAVANRRVLAVEAAEGTARMLAHIADLRRNGRLRLPPRAGVLVKAPKPKQNRRIDLPAIGPDTVRQAAAAGLAGIAVEAGGTIVADAQALGRAADAAGLFVIGVRAGRRQ